MREEFADPLPKLQEQATLLFGKSPIDCFIVESNEEYFRVAVPGVDHYEGDPRLTLATETDVYPVRLTRQERRAGGYSYLLQRLDPIYMITEQEKESSTWDSKNLSLAVATVLVVGCLALPSANQSLPWLVARSPDVSVQTPVTSNQQLPAAPARGEENRESLAGNEMNEVRDRAVSSTANRSSVVAPASMTITTSQKSSSVELSYEDSLETMVPKVSDRSADDKPVPSLKTLIEEGRVGRARALTKQMLPWLLNDQLDDHWMTVGISDTALSDLDQFKLSLGSLPKHQSSEAISQLAETLSKIGQDDVKAKRVNGFTDIYVLRSNDASIYFRVSRGRKELVRVLPVEM